MARQRLGHHLQPLVLLSSILHRTQYSYSSATCICFNGQLDVSRPHCCTTPSHPVVRDPQDHMSQLHCPVQDAQGVPATWVPVWASWNHKEIYDKVTGYCEAEEPIRGWVGHMCRAGCSQYHQSINALSCCLTTIHQCIPRSRLKAIPAKPLSLHTLHASEAIAHVSLRVSVVDLPMLCFTSHQ